jgi:hypothetical protein
MQGAKIMTGNDRALALRFHVTPDGGQPNCGPTGCDYPGFSCVGVGTCAAREYYICTRHC